MRQDFTPWYDTMLICQNGHIISDRLKKKPEDHKKHCSKCGSSTISQCPNCNKDIRGYKHIPRVIGVGITNTPVNCHECGVSYPWKKLIETKEASSEDPLNNLTRITNSFFKVARSLRSRHNNRPTLDITDEYDVQDLLRSLLNISFSDIRAEEWTPSYAGGSSRMDFLLKKEQIVIEVKKTRPTLKDKDIGEQLIIDIAKYKEHSDCKTLILFIYDPDGFIGNPHGLISDLEKSTSEDLVIKVIISPSH